MVDIPWVIKGYLVIFNLKGRRNENGVVKMAL